MPLTCTDQEFSTLVLNARSLAEVVRGLGRACVGSSYRLVRREVDRLGLSTRHWTGRAHGTARVAPRLTAAGVLVQDGRHSTGNVKKVILREGLLPYVCALCDIGPEWNGKPLVLRLDHKNGQRSDHRLLNLRFLCPNCDSQTDTFCGRNKPKKAGNSCCACGTPIGAASRQCRSCSQRSRSPRPTKITWPAADVLRKEIQATSFEATARRLGLSSNAIRKRLRCM